MKLRIAFVILATSSMAGCPSSEGELRPILLELFLPASLSRCNPDSADAVEAVCGAPDACTRFNQVFLCEDPSAQEVQSFSVRNIGEAKVTITGATFEASSEGGGLFGCSVGEPGMNSAAAAGALCAAVAMSLASISRRRRS